MSEMETGGQEPEFAAFVGIDWADQKHVWCLQGRDSTKRESGELKHTPEAVDKPTPRPSCSRAGPHAAWGSSGKQRDYWRHQR
jgi:hypothetical protein